MFATRKPLQPCTCLALALIAILALRTGNAQVDPGVQTANRGTGVPLTQIKNDDSGNNPGLNAFFADGLSRFQDVESVAQSPSNNNGLGPRFNFNQCAGCHVAPSIGGSSPTVNPIIAGLGPCDNVNELSREPVTFITESQLPAPTPAQVGTVACNSTNSIPTFVMTSNGPIREVRFPFFLNANGTANTNNPNGGVEDLVTVSGRPDGASQNGCSIMQPNFNAAHAANDIIFRIPTPLFGLGLVENLDESTLLINRLNNLDNSFGIAGRFNRNGNDGTITRFGWKAQNKSGHIFSGEAYNVEMGISNLLFTQDRPTPEEDGADGGDGTGLPSACLNLTGTGYPEDTSNPNPANTPAQALDDVSAFANFMRDLAPPLRGGVILNGNPVSQSSLNRGEKAFSSIGCATCHNAVTGTTQVSSFTSHSSGDGSLSLAPVRSFSDFELHHMGGLADNVAQGNAAGDEFRTAPLWGVGQRIFFLHDGRTSDLLVTIEDHCLPASSSAFPASEACTVEANFDALPATSGPRCQADGTNCVTSQQDVVSFVRSL